MWANRSICSYSDFNLAYVAEFQYKTGYAKKNKKIYKIDHNHDSPMYLNCNNMTCLYFHGC